MSLERLCRPCSMATRVVTQLPAKKSSTTEPGYESPHTNRWINSRGFCVGWPTRSRELPLSRPSRQTLVGLRPLRTLAGLSRLSRRYSSCVAAS